MSAQSTAQTNFNAGELSPRMAGRPDLAAYANGVAEMTNFVPLVQGAATKRPGTITMATAASQTVPARLIPWVPQATQAYVVEAAPNLFRYFTNNGLVLDDDDEVVETVTPWGADALAALNWHVSNDVIYIVDGSSAPRRLARTAANAFSLTILSLQNGPFKDQNTDKLLKITADGQTGIITLTATSGIFQPAHVGSLIQLEAEDFRNVPAWEPGITVNIDDRRRSDGKIYIAETSGRTGTVQPTHTTGAEYDGMTTGTDINSKPAGGIRWLFDTARWGVCRITSVTSATVAVASVQKKLPYSVLTGTWRWAFGAFSDVEGWPSAVTIFGERLWLAKNNRLYGSVVGDLGNFASQTDAGLVTADMAVNVALPSADQIRWIDGDRVLLAGTARAEYALLPLNSNQALGPANVQAVRQSRYGSAAVRPEPAGSRLLFVQRGGRKLRQMGYDFQADRYRAPDLTVRAQHIAKSGLKQLAMQDEPEALVWACCNDGRLVCLTFSEDEDVRGWAQQPLAGANAKVESLCVVPAPDGDSDDLVLAVSRTINGSTRRTLERLAPWRDAGDTLAEAIHLDGCVTYRGAPASAFSGLEHLAGETVAALVDGAVVTGLAVSSGGTCQLPPGISGSIVHIGLLFTARLVSMPLEVPASNGSSQGRIKKIVRVVVRLLDALGVNVGGKTGPRDALLPRPATIAPQLAMPPFTGDASVVFAGGYEREGVLVLESTSPLPATVLALFPATETGDR